MEHDEVSVGRGRPARRYRISSQGLRELGSNYEDLAVLLWSEVAAIDHEPTRARVFANLESRLIDRFRSADNNAALPERVAGLASRLADSGFDAGSDFSGGLPVLQGHTCPYPEIARDDRSICDLEARVFSAVLGAEVELRNRCLDGHNCCEFAVSENA